MGDVLELWTLKENFGYCQGMNDIVACITYAFYSEKMKCEFNTPDDAIKQGTEAMIRYIHSENSIKYDIFSVFDAIMKLGIKELFIQESSNDSFESRYIKQKKEQLFQWGADIANKSVYCDIG